MAAGPHQNFDIPVTERELRVLIVEDDEDDLLVLQEALAQSRIQWQTHITINGLEAVKWLENALKQNRPLPDFILSDIKTPLMDGFDMLQWVRSNTQLRHLRVVFFSSSSLPADLERARQLGANGYQVKPSEFLSYHEIVTSMDAAIRSNRPYLPI